MPDQRDEPPQTGRRDRLQLTSVRGLFTATILVLGGLTLVAAVAIHVVTFRVTRANEIFISEIANIQAMARIEANLYEVVRTGLLYGETGDRYLKEANERARTQLFEHLAEVEIDWSRHDEQSHHDVHDWIEIAEIRSLIEDYLREEEEQRLAALPPSQQMIAASAEFQAALRAINQSIASSSSAALETRYQLDNLGNQVTWLSLGAFALVAGAMIVLMIAARRLVFRSFESLQDALFAYSSGDTSVRVPEDGPTELRAMARAFNALTATLEQQRKNRYEFLLAVAHDLRNPLAALKVSVALAENRARSGSLTAEQVNQQQRRIFRQVDRLNRMVEDLVDMTRVEAGRLNLAFKVCDLRHLLEETQEIFDEASSLHDVRLELPEGPVPVRCDETRLGQVLNNLVSNAIKYSPQGGEVAVRLRRTGKLAIVEVEDEGTGISPSDQQRIFEPFQRGLASSIPGMGLGLSVAKRLIEAHEGRIEVESELGAGSLFRLELHLAEEERGPESRPSPAQDPSTLDRAAASESSGG